MGRVIAGLSCNVIQSTSDEATALIAYAENVLGAQHSPDLFHVQQEMSKAVSAPMAAKARAADRDIEKAAAAALATEAAAKAYQAALGTRGPGRPPNWLVHSHEAERAAHDAKAEVERIATVRATLRENIKGLGQDYHLADLVIGERSSGGVVLT